MHSIDENADSFGFDVDFLRLILLASFHALPGRCQWLLNYTSTKFRSRNHPVLISINSIKELIDVVCLLHLVIVQILLSLFFSSNQVLHWS
mmetsp:Transcript_21210/g.29718  ORF Transcript_21210/g.29718 Transcript_21210/m.29718 type:complete len:91 (+) Transcript_21210:160-432(+)